MPRPCAAGRPRNHSMTSTVTARPHQPATIMPRVRLPVAFQTPDSTQLAPVEGQAREEVEARRGRR